MLGIRDEEQFMTNLLERLAQPINQSINQSKSINQSINQSNQSINRSINQSIVIAIIVYQPIVLKNDTVTVMEKERKRNLDDVILNTVCTFCS